MLRIFMHPIAKIVAHAMRKSDKKTEKGKTLPSGVVERVDIAYISDGNRGHLLDVYAPENRTGDLPLIVDVHGGGLVYGNKEINKRFCYDLARRGFVVVSINYRLAPEVYLPEQIGDVTAAYRWVSTHAREIGADLTQTYLMGDSAGALLTLYALAATQSEAVRTAFGIMSGELEPKGLFLVSGMYNMLVGGYMKHLRNYALGRGYKKKPWAQYIEVRSLLAAIELPLLFMTSSAEDMLANQSDNFSRLLTELKVPHTYDRHPADGTHAYVHIYPVRFPEWDESQSIIASALEYICGG